MKHVAATSPRFSHRLGAAIALATTAALILLAHAHDGIDRHPAKSESRALHPFVVTQPLGKTQAVDPPSPSQVASQDHRYDGLADILYPLPEQF